MNTDDFWKIIDAVQTSEKHTDALVVKLKKILTELPAAEILDFGRELDLRIAESYRWDLWAVAYIIRGGCGDDSFDYFRGWLVAQGRQYFEAAMENAICAANRTDPDRYQCEEILSIAWSAYKTKTGEEMPHTGVPCPKEPAGVCWDEDKLEELYPELWKRFMTPDFKKAGKGWRHIALKTLFWGMGCLLCSLVSAWFLTKSAPTPFAAAIYPCLIATVLGSLFLVNQTFVEAFVMIVIAISISLLAHNSLSRFSARSGNTSLRSADFLFIAAFLGGFLPSRILREEW